MVASTQRWSHDAPVVALAALLGLVLALSGLSLADPGAGPWDTERAAGAGLALVGLAVLAWWLLGAAAALAAALLARAGRTAAAARVARLSPAAMRRITAAVVGTQLALAPAAFAAPEAPAAPGQQAQQAREDRPGGAAAPRPAWPADPSWPAAPARTGAPLPAWPTGGTGQPAGTGAPAEGMPRGAGMSGGGSGAGAAAVPAGLSTEGGAARAGLSTEGGAPTPAWRPERPAAPMDRVLGGRVRDAADREVVVRAGDTLWGLAAQSLGTGASEAAIAREWPRWYAANRAAIGSDPDQLAVGTVLVRPGPQ